MIKGVIFDMDGLLFDTEAYYHKAFRELSVKYIGHMDTHAANIASGTNGTYLLQKLKAAYPNTDCVSYLKEVQDLVYQWVKEYVPIKPGAIEIVEYLYHRNYKLAIASSSKKEIILNNLQKTHLKPYFHCIISSLEVKHPKPAPDIFIAAARNMQLRPQDCYVLEDSINGIQAGLAAGCSTIMVPDLKPPLKAFYDQCTGIFKNLYEVKKAIENKTI